MYKTPANGFLFCTMTSYTSFGVIWLAGKSHGIGVFTPGEMHDCGGASEKHHSCSAWVQLLVSKPIIVAGGAGKKFTFSGPNQTHSSLDGEVTAIHEVGLEKSVSLFRWDCSPCLTGAQKRLPLLDSLNRVKRNRCILTASTTIEENVSTSEPIPYCIKLGNTFLDIRVGRIFLRIARTAAVFDKSMTTHCL